MSTEFLTELYGGGTNRQVALMAAVEFYSGKPSNAQRVLRLAQEFLTFLETDS